VSRSDLTFFVTITMLLDHSVQYQTMVKCRDRKLQYTWWLHVVKKKKKKS